MALCAGAGGLELGISLALGERYATVCYVEREAYAAATLVARMEDQALDSAPVWDDLRTFDGAAWRGCVDIITGGYPCQPFSLAGKRLGASDERHLWPDVCRIVREVQPGLCFFENVPGHLSMGYADVERDLQGLGYRVAAGLYSAAEVGASHKRERLFIMAYRADFRREPHGAGEGITQAAKGRLSQFDGGRCELGNAPQRQANLGRPGSLEGSQGEGGRFDHAADHASADVADTRSKGLQGWRVSSGQDKELALPSNNSVGLFPPAPNDTDGWARTLKEYPALEPAVCGMADGLAYRVERLRLCGNGVVPLVAAKAFICLAAKLGIGT